MLTVFWKGYKMVHFVGAGSGAADLITIRGKKLLENADIIIYAGSLVNPELLEYAKKNFWKMQILLFMPVRLLIPSFWNMQKTVLKFITVQK